MINLIKNSFSSALTLMLVISLVGCATGRNGQGGIKKADVGAVAGAIGGAFAGQNLGKGKGQVLGIAAGTLLGAYLGHEIGASLDRADMAYYHQTSQKALENNKVGETSAWRNPDSGHSGTVTPTRTYQTASGTYCREYTQTITVGGKAENAYGKACRKPDGSWEIQQ